MANALRWDSFGVQCVCVISFTKNWVAQSNTSINPIIPGNQINLFLVSSRIKFEIYQRTHRHFWTMHTQHILKTTYPFCIMETERTGRLKGRGKKIEYIGCCFSKVPVFLYLFAIGHFRNRNCAWAAKGSGQMGRLMKKERNWSKSREGSISHKPKLTRRTGHTVYSHGVPIFPLPSGNGRSIFSDASV